MAHAGHALAQHLNLAVGISGDLEIARRLGGKAVLIEMKKATIITGQNKIRNLTPAIDQMLAQTDRPTDDTIGECRLLAIAKDRFIAGKAELNPNLVERFKIVLG